MKRLLISAISAGLLSMACGNGKSTVMSPTSSSADDSTRTTAGPVEKHYTVGGVVQSVVKPFAGLEGARVSVAGEGNDGKTAVSDAGGAFSLALTPGYVTLIVTKDGYAPWSTTIALFEHRPDIRATLQPTR